MNNLKVSAARHQKVDLGWTRVNRQTAAGLAVYEEVLDGEKVEALVVSNVDAPDRNIAVIELS